MFMCDNGFEREQYLENCLPKSYVKFHSIVGLLLNIIVPLYLLIFCKVSFLSYLIYFIVFDIFQVILEYFFIAIYKFFHSFSWVFEKKSYKKKVSEMSLEEIESFKKTLNKDTSFLNKKLGIVNEKIEELKKLEEMNIDLTSIKNKNEILYVEEMISKFENYNNFAWIKNYLNDIVTISKRVINLVKEDEDSIVIIINTYNIYSEELLKIIKQYEDMDEEQQARYMQKIIDLFETFSNHLLDLENKVQSFKEHSIDFDIDFLTKKLEEEKNNNV